MHVLRVCCGYLNFVWYICLVLSMVAGIDGGRDVVWEHGENLFPGFKCKYCVKEFRGGGATRLKEYLAGKNGNIAWCTKCPPDIREYFLHEL
jgi:hypothetical protein